LYNKHRLRNNQWGNSQGTPPNFWNCFESQGHSTVYQLWNWLLSLTLLYKLPHRFYASKTLTINMLHWNFRYYYYNMISCQRMIQYFK